MDDLAQQRVPEGVSGLVRRQHRGVNCLPELTLQVAIRRARRSLEQPMINTVPRHRGQLQGLLRPVGEAENPDIQRVAERVGHIDAALSGRPGELLDEVRDALAAPVDQIDRPTLLGGRSISWVSSSATSARSRAGTSMRTVPGKRPTSARKGRNGCRRVSSSLR